MTKTKTQGKVITARSKRVVAKTKTGKVAPGLRSLAIRRSAEGKFTKVILNRIGGKECPRFSPMTWKERDAFMAKPENAAVRERYKAHLASVKSENN
jgi:hypothetical protein